MAARQTTRRNTRRNTPKQNTGASSWMMLLVGVGLGLLIAWLIYASVHGNTTKQKTQKKPVASEEKQPPENALPQFDFYSILPELEVVIPEQFTDSLREALPNRGENKTAQTTANAAQPVEKPSNTYFIQAGSFKSPQDAERMKVNLLLLGMDVYINPVSVEGVKYHRVRIGPLKDYATFEQARNRLKENNIQYMVLKAR